MKQKLILFLLISVLFTYSAKAQVIPDNWTGDTDIEFFEETTAPYSGSSALGVVVISGDQGATDFVNNTQVTVTAGMTYTVTFWYKTSAHEEIRVVTQFEGAPPGYGSYTSAGVTDWTEYSYSSTVPDGATALQVGFRFYDQTGFVAPETQYMDNVTLTVDGVVVPIANGDFENWPALEEVDWCNLQWPENGTIDQGSTFDVYAWIWEDGVTTGAGQGAGIDAWIGVSTEDTDPSTWTTWIPASYNGDNGDNDEYMAEIGSALPAGTYYYASRFQVNGGVFAYGGYNAGGGHFWDGIDNVSGVLTVNFVPQIVSVPYTRDFETGDLYTDGWTTHVYTGTTDWEYTEFSGDHFAEISNYNGANTAAEAWLITPGIDLSGTTAPVFNFMNASNYSGDDIEIYVSDSYDGSSVPNIANWTSVPANLSTGGFDDVFSGDIDLSSYIGSTVYVAFRYIGTDSDGKTWQIDDFNVIDALPATQLSISNVSPVSPYTGQAFNVTVQSLDENGDLASVDQDTEVQINLASGTGSFAMTYTGTITSGTDEITISGLTYDVAETIEINAEAISGMTLTTSANYTMTVTTAPTIPAVFISEYIEGSGSNKAIELYNGTGSDVDMSAFRVVYANNGGGWSETYTFTAGHILADGEVFVLTTDAADAALMAEADDILSYPGVVFFNGDDAVGLQYTEDGGTTWYMADIIGDPDNDPGSAWDAAGVAGATANHTLVRKYPEVTMGNSDWTSSAGTNTEDSEWIVYNEDDFSYIGWHGEPPTDPALSITAPIDGSTHYTSTVNVDLNVQNFVVAAGGTGDGYLSVDLNGTTVDSYTTTFSLTNVPADTYTMTVTLVDNSGIPLDPNVSDMATFYVEELPAVSIYDIQYTEDVSGDSPYVGQTVQTEGIVTAIEEAVKDGKVVINYYIQDGTGAWNGVFVYDNNYLPAVGDHLSITADVVEYNGLTELSNVTDFTVLSSGNTLPEPVLLSTLDANAEDYEGVLIRVEDAECTAVPNTYNEWYVNDGTGDLQVDDNIFAYTPTLGSVYNITGIGHFGFGEYEISPRSIDDISVNPDISSLPEEPAVQVAGETLDATVVIDEANAAEIFRFNITDAGGDGLATHVDQMKFFAGDNMTIDINADIGGAYLVFTDTDEIIDMTGVPAVGSDYVFIPVDFATTIIPEGESREVACYMWFETTVADEAAVQFKIAETHGFTADESGSLFTDMIGAEIVGETFILDQNIGTDELSGNTFNIYPNPAREMLSISGTINSDRVEIINLLGQTVLETNATDAKTELQISNLDAGMYIVKIHSDKLTEIKTFIKK